MSSRLQFVPLAILLLIKMEKEKFREKLFLNNIEKINGFKKCKNNNKLKIIGITGSHGKSTIAFLLNQYLKLLGYETIMYSSIMIDSKNSVYVQNNAVEVPLENEVMLYHALTEAQENNVDFLILEVNESTINKGFINDLDMDIKVLTNIYEKENQIYDNYVELKKLFMKTGNHKSVLGLISDITIDLFKEMKDKDVKTYTTEFFIENKNINIEDVNYYLRPYKEEYNSFSGLVFEICGLNKKMKVKTNLNMPFHGIDLLCLLTIIDTLELLDRKIYKKFVSNIMIPGRDEIIKYKGGYIMISNTFIPHLEVLNSYRSSEINKITLITGASGNLFPTWNDFYKSDKFIKQREYDMDYAYTYAKKYADHIIITMNDPGNNNIKELLSTQFKYVQNFKQCDLFEDRTEAIKFAIKNIMPKELIFISGRGNREIMCKNNKIEKHLDKNVILRTIGELNNV